LFIVGCTLRGILPDAIPFLFGYQFGIILAEISSSFGIISKKIVSLFKNLYKISFQKLFLKAISTNFVPQE
jgi:hypothetical protein